jgi:ribosomal protein L21E
MTEFKVGDNVRYTGGDSCISSPEYIGVEGVVTASTGGSYGLTIKITKHTEGSKKLAANGILYPIGTNLELIEDEPFKVGDRVEATEDFVGFNGINKGTQGTVTSIEATAPGNEKYHGGKYLIGFETDNGERETVFDFRIKKVEKEEVTFKVGDKVTVKGWENGVNPSWEGRAGTVTHTSWTVSVKFDDVPDGSLFREGSFAPRYLEHVNTFTYSDIKIGDRIKRTRTFSDGTEETTTGTVGQWGSLTAYSKDRNPLAYASDLNRNTVTLELLERPEPKPEPKIWENRKKGDQIVREDEHGAQTIFTHEGDDEWTSLYLNNSKSGAFSSGKPSRGYEWDKTDIADAFENDDYTLTLIEA